MVNYKGVIFDLDGTLLNTLQDIATATNNVLSRHNLPMHELESFTNFIGNGIPQLVYRAMPDELLNNDTIRNILVAEVFTEYAKCKDKHTKAFVGINEVLDQLNAKGILLAILSNKAHQFMSDIINIHFPQNQFEAVIGARAGIASKPDPYSAIEIAEIMDLAPEQIIFVGDSQIDMQTAQNAGMFAVGVSWGFCPRKELKESGAKIIIDNPLQLMIFFNKD